MSGCINDVSMQAAAMAMMIKVAECDGHVHAKEIEVINRYMSQTNINKKEVIRFGRLTIHELKRIMGDKLVMGYMNVINEIVASDGLIHENESLILNEIRHKEWG